MAINHQDNSAEGIKSQLKNNPTIRQKVIRQQTKQHPDEMKSAVGQGTVARSPGPTPTTPTTGGHH
jgi:hypothetical protein